MAKSDLRWALLKVVEALARHARAIAAVPLVGGLFDLRFLYSALLPSYYRPLAGLSDQWPKWRVFAHFLLRGLPRGLSPTPLFSGALYLERARDAGIMIEDAKRATFWHWFRHGYPRRLLPTLLFDEQAYLARHPNVAESGQWTFRHFICRGFRKGYWPNNLFHPHTYSLLNGMASKSRAYQRYLTAGAIESEGQPYVSPLEAFLRQSRPDLIPSRFTKGALKEALARASAIEPQIAKGGTDRPLRQLPFGLERYQIIKHVREKLPRPTYGSVVCIPHCRLSGAALVAAELCRALLALYPDERVLLVRTELDVFARPDWFPEGIDSIEISTVTQQLRPEGRGAILLDLLIGVRPKRIFNVNSRLAWEVLDQYGNRLRLWSELYAYMFCWDYDKAGRRTGYPVDFFSTCFDNLDALLVDNVYLRESLARQFSLPASRANSIAILQTPVSPAQPRVVASAPRQGKNKILWAGRLDRQKRFDIVIEIALGLPDVEILAWGVPVIGDATYDMDALPGNLKMQGAYGQLDDLPLGEAALWLYTSHWDGLPTILLEVGLREVPLVASRVGGTGDVISEENSWPVDSVGDARSYIEAINAALADPDEARRRAKRMRELVLARHNRDLYRRALGGAMTERLARHA